MLFGSHGGMQGTNYKTISKPPLTSRTPKGCFDAMTLENMRKVRSPLTGLHTTPLHQPCPGNKRNLHSFIKKMFVVLRSRHYMGLWDPFQMAFLT